MKLFKSLDLELKQDNSGNYEFEGYASTFGNVDLGNDVVVSGAFSKSLQKDPSVPILWQHRMDEPIGKSSVLYEDQKGLKIGYKLPQDDSFVRDRVMPQIKIGSVKEMSIGYWVDDYDYDSKSGVRYLKDVSLFEVSLVTKAMNPEALITAFKSIESIRDVENYLRKHGISNSESKTLISMIHRLKDSSDQRDADQENSQREVDDFKGIMSELKDLKTLFSNNLIIT